MSRLLLLFYYCLQAKIKLELTYSAPSGGGGGGGGGDNEDDEDDGGGDDGGVWCVVCRGAYTRECVRWGRGRKCMGVSVKCGGWGGLREDVGYCFNKFCPLKI